MSARSSFQANLTLDLSWARPRHAYLAIAALGLFIYLQTVFFQFTYFDDYVLIVKDARFIGSLASIPKAFAQDVFHAGTVAYRPMLVVSFIVDTLWGGIHPWTYHLSNVALHLLASCLVFLMLGTMHVPRGWSFVLAMFFVAHPLFTQAVAWIPGRNDSLMAVFLLPSFVAWLCYLKKPSWPWAAIHLAGFGLGLFTKEAAVALPALCLLYLAFSGRVKTWNDWRVFLLAVGWLGIGLVWLWLRSRALQGPAEVPPMVFNTALENLRGFGSYIGKMLLPFQLSVLPVPVHINIWYGMASLAIIGLLFGLGGIADRRLFLLGLAWMVLFLAPHALRGTTFPNYLEHRMYLPMAGFLMMLGSSRLLRRIRLTYAPAALACCLVIGGFGLITARRSAVYFDSINLLYDAIEGAPSLALPHGYLGAVYIDRGWYVPAEAHLKQAIRLDPRDKDAYHNLGIVYEATGKMAKAEEAFRKALEIAPRSSIVLYNLGYLYQQTGKLDSALALYLRAVESKPGNIEAQLNLGMVYHQQGNLAMAEVQYRGTLALAPGCAQAWFDLGVLMLQQGRTAQGREYIIRATQLDPELRKLMP